MQGFILFNIFKKKQNSKTEKRQKDKKEFSFF